MKRSKLSQFLVISTPNFNCFQVRLTPKSLILSPVRSADKSNPLQCCLPKGSDLTIKSSDIVSCRPALYNEVKNKHRIKPDEVGHPVFMLIAHPVLKKNGKRLRKVLYFHHFTSHPSEAARIRDTWVHSILTNFFHDKRVDDLDFSSRVLIVLNPTSGTGNTTHKMSSVVGPMLQEAGIEYEVLITERQGHAHEIVQAEPNLAKRWSIWIFQDFYSVNV